jgi:O-methyltransferase domain
MSEQNPQSVQQHSPLDQMRQFIIGMIIPQAIHVAAKLDLADRVEKAPATLQELVAATRSDAAPLERLLKFLTSVGIFFEDAAGKYHQTPLSDTLRSDHPQSTRGFAILFGSELVWKSFGELATTVATGQPAFNHVFGTSFFEYLSRHPEDAAMFNNGMTSISFLDVPLIIAAYDFSAFGRIVDVGGGAGALLRGILSANPKLHGVLFDMPPVVKGADSLRIGSLASRCEIVGGDIFQNIPEGADAYLMRVVIHDWNDEDAVRILKTCRRAIPAHGKLLLVESVLKPRNQPDPGRFNDLTMLAVAPGGRERTEVEFKDLLRRAGFALTRVIPATGMTSIVEARPV